MDGVDPVEDIGECGRDRVGGRCVEVEWEVTGQVRFAGGFWLRGVCELRRQIIAVDVLVGVDVVASKVGVVREVPAGRGRRRILGIEHEHAAVRWGWWRRMIRAFAGPLVNPIPRPTVPVESGPDLSGRRIHRKIEEILVACSLELEIPDQAQLPCADGKPHELRSDGFRRSAFPDKPGPTPRAVSAARDLWARSRLDSDVQARGSRAGVGLEQGARRPAETCLLDVRHEGVVYAKNPAVAVLVDLELRTVDGQPSIELAQVDSGRSGRAAVDQVRDLGFGEICLTQSEQGEVRVEVGEGGGGWILSARARACQITGWFDDRAYRPRAGVSGQRGTRGDRCRGRRGLEGSEAPIVLDAGVEILGRASRTRICGPGDEHGERQQEQPGSGAPPAERIHGVRESQPGPGRIGSERAHAFLRTGSSKKIGPSEFTPTERRSTPELSRRLKFECGPRWGLHERSGNHARKLRSSLEDGFPGPVR